ncbi:MAG: transposase [Spirochaetes bacterium]|nr:transposase [Spirochaetota bacterium]
MKYGKETKEQVVLRILNKETTIRQMSEELGVHYTTVRDWVRQYRNKKEESFPGTGHLSASDAVRIPANPATHSGFYLPPLSH